MSEAVDTREHLKIAILCHPTYGGSGVVASELALSLAEEGHEVHLFSHEVPPRLALSSSPVQMHRAQGIPYPLFHSTPHDLAIASSILEYHRAGGLDILHAHYALPHAVSAYLARSAARTDTGRPAPRVVTTLHGTDITLVGNDPSYAPLTQFVIGASDAATAVSAWLAEETRARFCPDMDDCGIEVIHNFVDTDRFTPAAGRRAQDAPPTAVHVSNFRAVKRVPWLVRAFESATRGTDARLTLIGDGPEQDSARRIACDLGIAERVTFLGMRDALPELLAAADVFLLSSQEESFGLSALEAMACGTPVVSTNAGGVSEVLRHGETGFLASPDDIEGFAEHTRMLLSNLDAAHEMGRAARADALERFHPSRIIARYVDLYRRVLARPES